LSAFIAGIQEKYREGIAEFISGTGEMNQQIVADWV